MAEAWITVKPQFGYPRGEEMGKNRPPQTYRQYYLAGMCACETLAPYEEIPPEMVEAVFDTYGPASDGEPGFICTCPSCGTKQRIPLSKMLKVEVRNYREALVLGPATRSYRVMPLH